MTTDTAPYVRTIILPPRQLTDWEVEMLRAAQNTQRIYGDEIRPAKSMLGDDRRGRGREEMTPRLYERSALWRRIVAIFPGVEIGALWILMHDDGIIVTWRCVQKWEWRATP